MSLQSRVNEYREDHDGEKPTLLLHVDPESTQSVKDDLAEAGLSYTELTPFDIRVHDANDSAYYTFLENHEEIKHVEVEFPGSVMDEGNSHSLQDSSLRIKS